MIQALACLSLLQAIRAIDYVALPAAAVVNVGSVLDQFLGSTTYGWLGHPTAWMVPSSAEGQSAQATKSMYTSVSGILARVKAKMTKQVQLQRQGGDETSCITGSEPLISLCQPCMFVTRETLPRLEAIAQMVCRRHTARNTSWRAVLTLAACQRPWRQLSSGMTRKRLELEYAGFDLPAEAIYTVPADPIVTYDDHPVEAEPKPTSGGLFGGMLKNGLSGISGIGALGGALFGAKKDIVDPEAEAAPAPAVEVVRPRADWVAVRVAERDRAIVCTSARFGADPVEVAGKLVMMNPMSGKSLENGPELNGAVAVCVRGEISFADKASAALNAGGIYD